ncbi:hypothetical protein BDZ89DRAFT_352326 [Hymenopellis radicata]|nr:hypothetical protein BDZ89DRAFT_352326 [Hymenopellis radicata]
MESRVLWLSTYSGRQLYSSYFLEGYMTLHISNRCLSSCPPRKPFHMCALPMRTDKDEDGYRFSRPNSTMSPTTPHPRTLHLPTVDRAFRASPLLTPSAPAAIRVDLSSNLDTFIHHSSKEPATNIPSLKRMALAFRDLVWTIYVDAQPGARTITVRDVIRAVYSNLRTAVNSMEVKSLRGEQKAGLEEARGRRLANWPGGEKPGHTSLRRVDVLNRRTLFVGIRPSSSRSGDGSTMEWTICLEIAQE